MPALEAWLEFCSHVSEIAAFRWGSIAVGLVANGLLFYADSRAIVDPDLSGELYLLVLGSGGTASVMSAFAALSQPRLWAPALLLNLVPTAICAYRVAAA